MVDYYESFSALNHDTTDGKSETAIPFIDDDLNSNQINDDNWSLIDDRDYCLIADDDDTKERLKQQELQKQQFESIDDKSTDKFSIKRLSLDLTQDILQSMLFYLHIFLTLVLSYVYLASYANIEAFALTSFIFTLGVFLRVFISVLIKNQLFMGFAKLKEEGKHLEWKKLFMKVFLTLPQFFITLYQLDIIYW
jgi:hypothetical protein